MDNGIYTRQQSLIVAPPASVWVIGAGGVGYWVAHTLAMGGVPRIYIFDPDTISESNLNRIPLPDGAVGLNKAQIIAENLSRLRPDSLVIGMCVRWRPELITPLAPPEWIVPTTDTHASRRMCFDWAQTNGVKYLEAAAEGEYGSIASSPAEFATEDELLPGYASVPVWVGPCMAAGLLAGMHILHSATPNADVIRLGWTSGGNVDYAAK